VHLASTQPTRRRRGAALEGQLLAAAWEVLRQNGYASFTLDSVAKQACTSRPVIARRWASRHDLVRATIAHAAATRPIPAPETGSLRGDLIACRREINGALLDLATMLGVQFGGYYQETGETLAYLIGIMLRGQGLAMYPTVARRETLVPRTVPRRRSGEGLAGEKLQVSTGAPPGT
jgi:AcrR family transcriptional regulator